MSRKEPALNGARLKAARQRRRLSVPQLGQLARVSARHILRLEAGERPNVSAVVLARVAVALGVDINYLLGLSDSPEPKAR